MIFTPNGPAGQLPAPARRPAGGSGPGPGAVAVLIQAMISNPVQSSWAAPATRQPGQIPLAISTLRTASHGGEGR